MPTDLPPDYKPRPITDPADPTAPGSNPAYPPIPGDDMPGVSVPQPGPPVGVPGPDADVVDPPGWSEPPIVPGQNPVPVPSPAGTPTF